MEYLKAEDILQIHSFIIDEIGGSHGVRDREVIASAAQAPRQSFDDEEVYANVYKKAAVYLHCIAMNHSFIDGNRRTAVTTASIFLEENGYEIVAEESNFENFAVRVVEDGLEVDAIAEWLEENSEHQE